MPVQAETGGKVPSRGLGVMVVRGQLVRRAVSASRSPAVIHAWVAATSSGGQASAMTCWCSGSSSPLGRWMDMLLWR